MKGVDRSNRHFVACISIFLCACDDKPRAPAGVTPSSTTGTIIGTVRTGATPPAKVALPESVHKACGAELADTTVIVGENGALANAVVWIEDAPAAAASAPPPLLDQVKCAYVPPVLVGHTGGKLKVKNSDPLMHNVRAEDTFNVGMPLPQTIERALPASAGPLKIVCDVHPWMRADVMVLPHDQWAITDSSGRFTLKAVSAGKRPLRVWHPTLGEKAVSVEVPPGGEAKVAAEL